MKYWTYIKGEVPGAFAPAELATLPGFGMTTLVCPAEGEILEKNWRRAGEFEDIARAVTARDAATPPPPPLAAPAPEPGVSDVDGLIDSASTRLFSHVADLMKELETRRDEKALVVSLQRQITVLKEELAQSREHATMLELRVPRIAELEEAHRKDLTALGAVREDLAQKESALGDTRMAAEKLRGELEAAKRKVTEAGNDLAIRNRLVDKLSRDLSDKELSLAKSLGVIRRLEEDLNKLCPPSGASVLDAIRPSSAAPVPGEKHPDPDIVPIVPLDPPADHKTPPPAFTADEPPQAPPYLEPTPPERPKAQEALMGFLKKVFPGPGPSH